MSNNDLIDQTKKQIRSLFEAARAAIGSDDARVKLAVDQLRTSSEDYAIPTEVREVADECQKELGRALRAESLKRLEQAVDDLERAVPALNQAIDIAEAGQKDLLLPAVADAAKETQAAIEATRKSVEQLREEMQAVAAAEPADLPARLKSLKAAFESLAASFKAGPKAT